VHGIAHVHDHPSGSSRETKLLKEAMEKEKSHGKGTPFSHESMGSVDFFTLIGERKLILKIHPFCIEP